MWGINVKNIGAIGFGLRIGHIAGCMVKTGECNVKAIADINIASAKARVSEFISGEKEYIDTINFYEDYHEMLEKENLDGILVGTRCSLHAEIASELMEYGVPIFMEKPVAINERDMEMLIESVEKYPDCAKKCVVSFPLRNTPIVKYVKELIESGVIGEVAHIQAINNVPYGRVYYHGWYRDEEETGGLWLQKATHDFDYITYIAGVKPVAICAMESKQVFKGNEPAGQMCGDCPKKRDCPESIENIERYGTVEVETPHFCCFAEDTGNQDSGSAIIKYENGMHAVYSQDFIARKGAGKRGARFIGYDGTIEFDWVKNRVDVFMHNKAYNNTVQFDDNTPHFGGDDALVRNFIDVMKDKDISRSTIYDGILSANMCLKAKKAAQTNTYQQI